MTIHGYGHSIPIPYISNEWIVAIFISGETIITNNLHVLKLTKYITKQKNLLFQQFYNVPVNLFFKTTNDFKQILVWRKFE